MRKGPGILGDIVREEEWRTCAVERQILPKGTRPMRRKIPSKVKCNALTDEVMDDLTGGSDIVRVED